MLLLFNRAWFKKGGLKMSKIELGAKVYSNNKEVDSQSQIVRSLRSCPIPDDEILENLGLFLTSKNLSRIFFMEHIYKQIVEVPGVVMEMGTRFGNNISSGTNPHIA